MTTAISRQKTEPVQSWLDQRPRARRVAQIVAVALGRLLQGVLAAVVGAVLGVAVLVCLFLMSGLVMPLPAKPPQMMTNVVALAMLVGGSVMAVVFVMLVDAALRRDQRSRRDAARDVVTQAILVRKLGDRVVLGRLRLGVTRGGGLAWSQPMVLGLDPADESTTQDRLRVRMADRLVVEVAGVFRQSLEVDTSEQTQARARIDDLLSRLRLLETSRRVGDDQVHVFSESEALEAAADRVRRALEDVPEHVRLRIEEELVLAGTMSQRRFDHLRATGTAETMLGRTPVPDVVPDEWTTGGQDDQAGGS